MRKLYLLLLAAILFDTAGAQCTNGRYWDEIFPTINKTTVTYSTVYSQQMDIYQPAGDTASARPLIILAHGGSFISGDRTNDTTILNLCQRFAQRGYVTVSIDYRIMDAPAFLSNADSAIDEVAMAISDGKAALRFFMNDRATTNTYKIDTNNIYAGGNSAGAVLYMHVGYIDSLGACPPGIAAAIASNGGFEGNSGFPGYTTKLNAVINLAGALNETSFVHTGSRPSVNAQGTADATVPYNCGNPLGGFGALSTITLCGLGALEPVYVSSSIYHMSHIFPGDAHVPWSTDPVKFNTVDSMIKVFLFNFVCPGVVYTEVKGVNFVPELSISPNPAVNEVKITSSEPIRDIAVIDQTGRVIHSLTGLNNENYDLNTADFIRGVYFVKILFHNELVAPVVKRIVVE
jgi:dienelactone hydrolase